MLVPIKVFVGPADKDIGGDAMRALALSLMLIGCGPTFPDALEIKDTQVDPDLRYLYDEWIQEMRDAGVDVSSLSIPHEIRYVENIDLGYAGLCVADWESWVVYIKRRESIEVLRALMWHELGHCVLDMDHWLTVPVDIMFPTLTASSSAWRDAWPKARERYLHAAVTGDIPTLED